VRLLRWRLWVLRGRPDLLCLATGYGWLAIGLLGVAAAFAAGHHLTAALHVITVGGLGTLTWNVMAMTWTPKLRQGARRSYLPIWSTLLIAAATLARVLAGLQLYDPRALLLVASLCWSGAFAVLLLLLVLLRAPIR
jgi:uncharacterized protein involved in response to NO